MRSQHETNHRQLSLSAVRATSHSASGRLHGSGDSSSNPVSTAHDQYTAYHTPAKHIAPSRHPMTAPTHELLSPLLPCLVHHACRCHHLSLLHLAIILVRLNLSLCVCHVAMQFSLLALLAVLALATAVVPTASAALLHSVSPASVPAHVRPLPTPPLSTANVTVLLTLTQSDPTIAAKLVAERSDPSSPLYLQWLDKATLGSLLSAQPISDDEVSGWLSSAADVAVTWRWGPYIQMTGSVTAIERLFNTTLAHYYNTASNTTAIRQTDNSYLPDALDAHIANVDGLHTGDIVSPLHATAHRPRGGNSHRFRPMTLDGAYTSAELSSRYGTPNTLLATATNTNAATSVGVIQLSDDENYDLNALYEFGQLEGFTIANLSTLVTAIELVSPHATNTPSSGDNDESMLDLEAVVSVTTTSQLYAMKLGAQDIDSPANLLPYLQDVSPLPQVMSLSYSYVESQFHGRNTLTTYESQVQALTALGVTFVAATGDTGYNDGIGWPATSAYVLAVGGTAFSGTGTAITEAAWDDSTGGLSSQIARPSYQTTANTGIDTTFRAVPDVSALASDWFLVYGDAGKEQSTEVGGTSLATPIWAGVITYLNAISLQLKGNTLGYINPLLYSMAANCSTCFHDITAGSSNGYSAKVGYDLITGLGSPNLPAMEAYLTALLSGTTAAPTASSSSTAAATVPSSSSSSSTVALRGVSSSSSSSTSTHRVVLLSSSSSSSSSTAVPGASSSSSAVQSSTAVPHMSSSSSSSSSSSASSGGQCTLNENTAVGSFGNSRYLSVDSAPAGGLYTSAVTLTSSFNVAGLGIQLPAAMGYQGRTDSIIQLALYQAVSDHSYQLLASTAAVTVSGSGGNVVVPLTDAVQLPVGVVYVGLLVLSTGPNGVLVYADNNYGAIIGPTVGADSLPSSFSTYSGNHPFRVELLAC